MPEPSARRIAMERARQSKRPSRQGQRAGTSSPARTMDDAGMPRLLEGALAQARTADNLESALAVLLTLNGQVPETVSRRALTGPESAAVAVRFGQAGRLEGESVFTGTVGLTRAGKVLIAVPIDDDPVCESMIAGTAAEVSWTRADIEAFELALPAIRRGQASEVAACRAWLEEKTDAQRAAILARLRDAMLRTPPFMLYRGQRLYTNFREENNLTGKSLSPDHPHCVLHGLEHVAPVQWSDDQAVLVTCMFLLATSGGNHRIEECNGMQISLRQVTELFREKRRIYAEAGVILGGDDLTVGPTPAELEDAAHHLSIARTELLETHLLYRSISAPIMHRRERLVKRRREVTARESAVLERLREHLPIGAMSIAEAETELRTDSAWLASPHGEFGTGLESLIYRTVQTCAEFFAVDFALSRGFRSLGKLMRAVRAEDWAGICSWELPEFFCCVVPTTSALGSFGGSWQAVADTTWAMSARMQYNTWHFLAGNLPKVPAVRARDYFTPASMPDLSYASDQHHRGHVYNKIRFTIRCPQSVDLDGRRFDAFTDLRLVRCAGDPLGEQDLLDLYRISRLIAVGTECAAQRVAEGQAIEVHSFDHVWHRDWVERHLR